MLCLWLQHFPVGTVDTLFGQMHIATSGWVLGYRCEPGPSVCAGDGQQVEKRQGVFNGVFKENNG